MAPRDTRHADTHRNAIGQTIIVAVFARLVLNTARRFAYPFAPALSRGLGVPLTAVTSLIAINQITALLGVMVGPVVDRLGYRRMMLVGMGILVVGMWVGASFGVYWAVLVALLLAGVGKTIFDPAIQAYIGHNVDYTKRGLAVGAIETSWAGSSLLGIPLMGFVMQRWGWPATFWALGLLALVGILGIFFFMHRDRPTPEMRPSPQAFWTSLTALLKERAVVGVYGLGLFISIAGDTVFVVFGAWLETAFGLGLASLGLATAVIGAAELTAEAGVALLADRIGLYRAVLIGSCGLLVSYLLLPASGQFLALALVALFVVFVCFEFSVVATISLCTELYPSGRATMMAGFYAVSALGRVAGALLGGVIWTRFGWNAVCAVAMISTVLAMTALIWGVRHWRPPIRSL